MTQVSSVVIDPKQSIASIVLAHSECAALFQQWRIDFCCKGEQSLESACAARSLPVPEVVRNLADTIQKRAGTNRSPAELSTPDLINHIVGTHHEYLRKTLPFVVNLAKKVARVHGDHNPRLREVDAIVVALNAELLPHLDQEEQVLFPSLQNGTAQAGQLRVELECMKTEHLAVGELLGRLRDEAEEFRPPEWACTSYRTLMSELAQLELDVLRHVHLENHVLAPRFV